MVGQFILALMILVTLHEMGHYFPAKWFKTRVEKFYLFFDWPLSLFRGKKIDGKWEFRSVFNKKPYSQDNPDITEWGIGMLPLGGYVKIAGMVDESFDKEQLKLPAQPWEFRSKNAIQRLIIMVGGVTVNFFLGMFIFVGLLWYYGEKYIPTTAVKDGIYVDSLGMKLGLQTGDKIIATGDKPFDKFSDVLVKRAIIFEDARTIKVERNGQEVVLQVPDGTVGEMARFANKDKALFSIPFPFVIKEFKDDKSPGKVGGLAPGDRLIALNGIPTPYFQDFKKAIEGKKDTTVNITALRGTDTLQLAIKTNKEGQLEAAPDIEKFITFEREKYSLIQAIPAGFRKGWTTLTDQITAFGHLFSGKIKATESLGGIGSFAQAFGTTWNWEHFWLLTGMISLVLAFINILPIPILDGGHVMFLFYEIISGRKPSDKFVEIASTIGLILVGSLFLFSTGLDVWRGCN
jgi:regulator of sigma E protease